MEKLSLLPLHQAESLSSGIYVHHHGTMPYLSVTSIYIVCTNYCHVTLIPTNVQLSYDSLLVWVQVVIKNSIGVAPGMLMQAKYWH